MGYTFGEIKARYGSIKRVYQIEISQNVSSNFEESYIGRHDYFDIVKKFLEPIKNKLLTIEQDISKLINLTSTNYKNTSYNLSELQNKKYNEMYNKICILCVKLTDSVSKAFNNLKNEYNELEKKQKETFTTINVQIKKYEENDRQIKSLLKNGDVNSEKIVRIKSAANNAFLKNLESLIPEASTNNTALKDILNRGLKKV